MVMKKNIDAMNHPTKVKESIGERIYTIVVYLLLILISATIILPLLHIISGSFSDPMQLPILSSPGHAQTKALRPPCMRRF